MGGISRKREIPPWEKKGNCRPPAVRKGLKRWKKGNLVFSSAKIPGQGGSRTERLVEEGEGKVYFAFHGRSKFLH